MTRIRIFQLLVVSSVLFHLVWLVSPYTPKAVSLEVTEILRWSGYGALPLLEHPLVSIFAAVAKAVAALGLFMFLSWGRWLLLTEAAISIALLPFSGVAVVAPIDGLFGGLTTVIDGAILGLAFSSPIAESMRKDG